MGECDKKQTYEILDYFFEHGGNFIDTANAYQGEESEEWIGDWMEERDNRDQMVIATKFTTYFPSGKNNKSIRSNFTGNSTKSMRASVDASLKKLKTDYIDILYVHWWDFSTCIPEIMQQLNHLVASGKVLYLGISDTPAWVVAKANEYARNHGLSQFCIYQGRWSAADRDFERDIIPMCQAEGMALAPFGTLGSGRFKTQKERESRVAGDRMALPVTDKTLKVSAALEKIAQAKGTLITSVALAYVMHKTPNVYPIVGGRKIEHLKGNIDALSLQLSDKEIDEIDDAAPFDVGFPSDLLFQGVSDPNRKFNLRMTTEDMPLLQMGSYLATVEKQRPAKAHSLKHFDKVAAWGNAHEG